MVEKKEAKNGSLQLGDANGLEKALRLCARESAGLSQALGDLETPPAAPSAMHQRLSSDLGEHLARKGKFVELVALAQRGWWKALFPDHRWADPFDAIAARGAKGYACLDALDAAGVEFFGESANLSQGRSPLCSAAARLDGEALNYFLTKMATQKTTLARAFSERARLARQALAHKRQRELVAPMIMADPKAWAHLVEDGRIGALATALEEGLLSLAEAIIEANPEDVKLLDPARCAFSSAPVKALELLAKHGADLNRRGWLGASALQMAMHARAHVKSLAAKLISFVADPRAVDENGTTPIGAAMARWTWAELRKILGATPKDLMDSVSTSSMHGVELRPTVIETLRMLKHSMKANNASLYESADARMAEIVAAASVDPRAQEIKFIEDGMRACADYGLPKCLEAFVVIGAKHGASLRAELLASAISALPMDEIQEGGRILCLRMAHKMGVDLNEEYSVKRWHGGGEKTTLIEESVQGAMEHSDPGSNYFEPLAKKAMVLAELGCDPSKLKGGEPEPGWSFDASGAGRGKLSNQIRLMFEAMDSAVEANALCASLGAAPARKKNGGMRI